MKLLRSSKLINILDSILVAALLGGVVVVFGYPYNIVPSYSVSSLPFESSDLSSPDEAENSPPSRIDQDELVTSSQVLFIGDVLLARNVELLMDMYGLEYPWVKIKPVLSDFELVIGNFESAIAEPHYRTRAYTTQFSTGIKYLTTLKNSGLTHLSLSNNHALDFGRSGYDRAYASLKYAGLGVFGHPTDHSSTTSLTYINNNGVEIALIGLQAVFSAPTKETIEEILSEASVNSDRQVVYIHWGTEYDLHHDDLQMSLSKLLVNAGADLIVGHHPHVAQDIQLIDGVPVFYSLGNFLFDQYFSQDVEEGFMLAVSFDQNGMSYTIMPVTSLGTRSQPRLMDDPQKDDFLDRLAKRSSSELLENIKSGKGFIEYPLATSSQTSIISE